MDYDFDKDIDRGKNSGTFSSKWNIKEGELALWVADMDFATAPQICEAIAKRAQHGIFGYTDVPDEWKAAIASWWKKKHDFNMKEDALVFCTGVVPAISSIVRKLTTPGEKVLVQTPVYNIFFNSIINNGRIVVENPLCYKDGLYSVDWDDLEKKLSDPQVTLMILCNPHNPTGNIWSKEELSRLGLLCQKYGVTVVSDEIHCDITERGFAYTPFASVSEVNANLSVSCISASKAFNLAGLQSAAIYAENTRLRHKVSRGLNTDEVAEPNVFAIPATIAAFTEGGPWLERLCDYLTENRKFAEEFIATRIKDLRPVHARATYLMWVDCSKITSNTTSLASFIRKETGLFVLAGSQYGECGAPFLRLNLACPRFRLKDAMERLEKAVSLFLERKAG